MPIAGEFPRGSMPGAQLRAKAPPEHNLVQNPSLTRGIQLMTGMRQAHVAPALSEGLQPTLLSGDIRQDPRTRYPLSFASMLECVGDTVNPPGLTFANPPDHNRIVQLRRFHAFSTEGSGGPLAAYFYYATSLANIIPTTQIHQGTRLLWGYNNGASPQFFPPTQVYPGTDPRTSRAGWVVAQRTTLNANYIWRSPFFGTSITATGWQYSDILEDFDDVRGPRIVLYPGSAIDFGISDGNGSAYMNMWWDEFDLT